MNKEPINDTLGKPMYETDPTYARYNSLQLQCYDQRKEINRLKDRIKLLEEAGDAILNANNDDEEYEAIKHWNKAKEAKP
jgi:predicted esterase YcpF (UPF0227 family)